MKCSIIRQICFLLAFLFLVNPVAFAYYSQNNFYIEQLSHDDFVELNQNPSHKKDIVYKLLNTAIINNRISPFMTPVRNSHPKVGNFIRVAQWDLKFNMDPENIVNAFVNPDKLIELAKESHEAKSNFLVRTSKKIKNKDILSERSFSNIEKKIREQSEILRAADVIVINNMDIGMPRTDYKNCSYELAKKLGYNYVFVPEFLEIDLAGLGIEKHPWSEEMVLKEYGKVKKYTVDKTKYKGITGTAILSRFPLENVKVIRLENVYDWYNSEKGKETLMENTMRHIAKSIFKEEVLRRTRIGGRVAIRADIKLPEQTITIVGTQIERRTRAIERTVQMKELLRKIKDIPNPAVLAGNFNTSTYNHNPKSFGGMIKDKLTDPDSLIELSAMPFLALGVVGGWFIRPAIDATRKVSDPTVMSIPILSPNREKRMFNRLRRFRFDDGYAFDFRGNKDTSINQSNKLLSSSNERAMKGFVSTYQTKRNLGISNFKLSWIIGKGYNKKPLPQTNAIEKMAPHFGRTLFSLNYEYKFPISMQAPIVADFPLTDYKTKKENNL